MARPGLAAGVVAPITIVTPPQAAARSVRGAPIAVVTLRSAASPLSIRAMFRVGSVDDPKPIEQTFTGGWRSAGTKK